METGSREYVTIPKGGGYVYAYENQLSNTQNRRKNKVSNYTGSYVSTVIFH